MKIAVIFDRPNEATLGVYYERALGRLGIETGHFWLKGADAIEPVFDAYLRVDDGDYKYDIPHDRLKPSKSACRGQGSKSKPNSLFSSV
jgi:hypothetical protein